MYIRTICQVVGSAKFVNSAQTNNSLSTVAMSWSSSSTLLIKEIGSLLCRIVCLFFNFQTHNAPNPNSSQEKYHYHAHITHLCNDGQVSLESHLTFMTVLHTGVPTLTNSCSSLVAQFSPYITDRSLDESFLKAKPLWHCQATYKTSLYIQNSWQRRGSSPPKPPTPLLATQHGSLLYDMLKIGSWISLKSLWSKDMALLTMAMLDTFWWQKTQQRFLTSSPVSTLDEAFTKTGRISQKATVSSSTFSMRFTAHDHARALACTYYMYVRIGIPTSGASTVVQLCNGLWAYWINMIGYQTPGWIRHLHSRCKRHSGWVLAWLHTLAHWRAGPQRWPSKVGYLQCGRLKYMLSEIIDDRTI